MLFDLVFGVSEDANALSCMYLVITSPKLVVGFTLAFSFVTLCLTSSREGWKTVEVFVLCNPCFYWLR